MLTYRQQLEKTIESGISLIPIFGVQEVYDGATGKIAGYSCACGQNRCGHSLGKAPMIGWKHMNAESAVRSTMKDVDRWMSRLPLGAPINWAAHLRLSKLCCVDVDPRNGGLESWEKFIKPRLGTIEAQKTPMWCDEMDGGGWHIFYSAPVPGTLPPTSCIELYPGIEFKHGNTFVVIPPRRHSSGKQYVWANDFSPLNSKLV